MLIPPLSAPAWSYQRYRQDEPSGFTKLWFSLGPMDIGTGDVRVQWVRAYASRIFLKNLDVVVRLKPCEAKGHSILQPEWFGLLGNSSGMLEPARASPRELIADLSPQLVFYDITLVAWNLPWWEYLYHRNQHMLQIRAPHQLSWLWNVYQHTQEVILTLASPWPHLWNCWAQREAIPFAVVSLHVLLWAGSLWLVLSSTMLSLRESIGGWGCVAEDHQGDDSAPFTDELFDRQVPIPL